MVEETRQAGLETGLQEIRGNMQVTSLTQQVNGHIGSSQGSDQTEMGQDGVIRPAVQDDTQAGLTDRTNDDTGSIHISGIHFVQHEAPEKISPTKTNESNPQPKFRCTTGKDDR